MPRRAPSRNHPTTKYARDVQAGRILAGPYVRQATARHLLDLQEGHRRGLYFDAEEADAVIAFYEETLIHPEGEFEGQPFLLEPFQKFIKGSQHAWRGPNGQRFWISVTITGKCSGKTPLGAGGCLYRLMHGGSADQIYCVAVTGKQAHEQLWTDCKNFVARSPELRREIAVNNHTYRLTRGMSFIGVFSSDAPAASGFRVSHAAIDELQGYPSSAVVQETQKGRKNAVDPLIDILTNSTGDIHSVCGQYTAWAQRVLEGSLPGGDPAFANDGLFAYPCALDDEDFLEPGADGKPDKSQPPSMARIYSRPRSWIKACPGLGTILKESYLEEEAKQAVEMPGNQQKTMQLNFCVATDAAAVWIPDAVWMACEAKQPLGLVVGGRPPARRNLYEELKHCPCILGMDLAKTSDLSALAAIFPPHGDRKLWAYLEWYWIDEGTAKKREKNDKVPYTRWISQGHIYATPGNVVDFDFVQADILRQAGLFDVKAIAYDRTFANQIVDNLGQQGLVMVEWAQTPWNMDAGISEIERQMRGGLAEHSGHPVTRWCVSNVALRPDPNLNHGLDKVRSKGRIDGATALANGMGWAVRIVSEEGSVYNDADHEGGLLVL